MAVTVVMMVGVKLGEGSRWALTSEEESIKTVYMYMYIKLEYLTHVL